MCERNYLKNKKWNKKHILLLVSLIMVFAVSVVGTSAYLVTQTGPVKNEFTLVTVPNEVVETIEGQVKKDVMIQNTSKSEPAYIRAAVVVSWVKEEVGSDGKPIVNVHGTVPRLGEDYSIDFVDENAAPDAPKWILGKDDYYYWPNVVEAEGVTGILIDEAKLLDSATIPEGYNLSIEILGQSIQADGKDEEGNRPVVLAWGTENGGSVQGVDDTTLTLDIVPKVEP